MGTHECKVSITSAESEEIYQVTIYHDKEKNVIFYTENDKTHNIFDYEENILKRDNEQMSLEFKFKLNETTHNSIYIKDLNNTISVDILTKEIQKDKNMLTIIYEMNDNIFKYQIEKVI